MSTDGRRAIKPASLRAAERAGFQAAERACAEIEGLGAIIADELRFADADPQALAQAYIALWVAFLSCSVGAMTASLGPKATQQALTSLLESTKTHARRN